MPGLGSYRTWTRTARCDTRDRIPVLTGYPLCARCLLPGLLALPRYGSHTFPLITTHRCTGTFTPSLTAAGLDYLPA